MKIVRMGIVGSGHMGRTYSHCLRYHNTGVKLVAISGGSRGPKLASDFEIEFIPEYTHMLERDDIDAVLLATPHSVHAEQTILAAKFGKHVLVEKPMMTNVADCDAMIDSCKKANVQLSVIQTLRFRGVFRNAKKLIDQGLIGNIRAIQMTTLWKGSLYKSKNYGKWSKPWTDAVENGGFILDRGAHCFDLLRFLTNDNATKIFGTVNSYDVETWRSMNAMVQVNFSRGITAQVWMSHELPDPGFPNTNDAVRIWGEKGLIQADHFGKLSVTRDGKWEDVWEMPQFEPMGEDFSATRLEAFHLQTQDFIDSLLQKRPPSVTGEDGRATIEMVEACHLSTLTGGSVSLPLPKTKGGFQFDGATVPRNIIPG